jgi:hypothetical protein
MKLSVAILLGSVGSEQGFGQFEDTLGRTCAWGAAYKAAGAVMPLWCFVVDEMPKEFRWALNTFVEHPVTGTELKVTQIIAGLNDMHKWTRPQIAAWVATIEPQEEDAKCTTTLTIPNSSTCPVA